MTSGTIRMLDNVAAREAMRHAPVASRARPALEAAGRKSSSWKIEPLFDDSAVCVSKVPSSRRSRAWRLALEGALVRGLVGQDQRRVYELRGKQLRNDSCAYFSSAPSAQNQRGARSSSRPARWTRSTHPQERRSLGPLDRERRIDCSRSRSFLRSRQLRRRSRRSTSASRDQRPSCAPQYVEHPAWSAPILSRLARSGDGA